MEDIEIGGVLEAQKVAASNRVEVGGSIRTDQGLTAAFIEIGRRGEVRGDLKADEVIIGKDAQAENVFGKRILLRRGASVANVYGEEITIESDCNIAGEIQYTHELRADAHVSMAKTPVKVDKLPF